MSASTIRLAAGVAAALAITVAGGPVVAVAAADPGFAGSPPGHSRDGGHQSRDRDDQRDHRGGRDGDRRGAGPRDGSPGGRGTADPDGSPSVVVVEPATVPQTTNATTTPTHGSFAAPVPQTATIRPTNPTVTGRSGGGAAPRASAPTPPRVVVGNGRTPVPVRIPAEVDVAPTPPRDVTVPPPDAPVVAPVVAPAPMTVQVTPAPRLELPAPAPWPTVRPGWPTGTIFGIAGLLLAPIAGMWLGHRQARATRSASELVSR